MARPRKYPPNWQFVREESVQIVKLKLYINIAHNMLEANRKKPQNVENVDVVILKEKQKILHLL
jgi:hypothetical protein